MDISKRIVSLRQKQNLTQNKLADKAGISQTHLRRVELGKADVTIGLLELICDALEITLKDFFNVNEEKEELAIAISKLTQKQKNLLLEFLKSI